MNYSNILPRHLRPSQPLSSMAARLLHYLFLPEVKNITDDACRHLLKFPCTTFSQPPPPPPPLADHHGSSVSPIVIILIAVLSSCFLLVSYYAIIVKFCCRWRSPRAAIAELDGLQQGDSESDHDSVSAANFVWYINTVGLEESVITSITVCKYRRREGLVNSTDCSVCLTEFRENDCLRLLPKCGHAFHVPCIDTWLTSHVNCPLCRAPIVASVDVDPAPVSPQASITDNSDIVTVGFSPNSANEGQSSLRVEEYGRRGLDLEAALSSVPSSREYYRMRVLSDLADNHRLDEVMGGDGVQQARRSVSMDDSSAGSMVGLSVADLLPGTMEQLHERQTRTSAGECSEENMRSGHSFPKHYGVSRRWNQLSSKRRWGSSMLSRPIAMKRSYSTGGRLLLLRYNRNSSSVLPL